MRKNLLISMIICGLLVFASSSWAYSLSVNDTNVGDSDLIIANALLANSGDATELAWLKGILGTDIIITAKYDVGQNDWMATNNANVWALSLSGNPEYYYIKTGNIKVPGAVNYEHFLYKNLAELAWAVIDLTEWGGTNVNIGKVSHIGTTPGVRVPEPTTMLLLGLGLMGLAGVRRKL